MSADEITAMKAQLDRIELALVGDPAMGHTGLVGRQAATETRVDALEESRKAEVEQRKGALWVISAAASVGGVVSWAITWLATNFGGGPRP